MMLFSIAARDDFARARRVSLLLISAASTIPARVGDIVSRARAASISPVATTAPHIRPASERPSSPAAISPLIAFEEADSGLISAFQE